MMKLARCERDNPGWFQNSAGFWFNSRFGFGLMNAHALVIAAQNWTTVPEKNVCLVKPLPIWNMTLNYGNPRIVSFDVSRCDLGDEKEVSFLEHVQIETSIKYTLRGALQMRLTSPAGTEIQILNPRELDKSVEGFAKWKFMSVATWGEDPRGTWTLEISDQMGPEGNRGIIEDLTLILHGTEKEPIYRKNGPRIYNDEYNRIRKMNRLEQLVDEDRNDEWIFKNDNELNLPREDEESNEIFNINWLAGFFRS